ncbi:MAG: NUDIX domain-containing protein [Thiohalocapsa sp.]|jgi:bis(5'-nucleosidyl)-tetraphosphatase|uniref:NUDIX domain-containing protein n=1 Tax=Thiohalocapsa sp. TaxID=2497641 RepID=UPI0025F8CA63|nr:NUDIX domain-containing protein [Thiohalocapsa sp.]MCG6942248.1 NUDIX domain-containing protein [Thiohalocapsa sp.]
MTEQPTTRSAGIIPVRIANDAARFLLLRAYNYWDFPKGELAPGEAPLAAALREATEETGLSGFTLRWGEDYIETERYGRGKIARYYLAEAPAGEVRLPVSPELGRPEHHEFRWVSAVQADTLLNARLRRVLAWALQRLGEPSGRGSG